LRSAAYAIPPQELGERITALELPRAVTTARRHYPRAVATSRRHYRAPSLPRAVTTARRHYIEPLTPPLRELSRKVLGMLVKLASSRRGAALGRTATRVWILPRKMTIG
jgi:hypothetical protein